LRNDFVVRRNPLHQVVAPLRDVSQREPWVTAHQPLKVLQIDDLQMVLANDGAEKLGVVPHDVGGKIERALGDQLRLLFEPVIGGPNVQSRQIGGAEKEAHQVGRA
jgi:hypothetical protein